MDKLKFALFLILIAFCVCQVADGYNFVKGCRRGYNWNGVRCVPDGSVSWNEQCASKYNCGPNMKCIATSPTANSKKHYTCQCVAGTAWDHNMQQCIDWDSDLRGQSCLNDSSCFNNMVCVNNSCECDVNNNYVWTNYSCVERHSLSLYSYCLTDEACDTSLGLYCSTNYVCECQADTTWNFQKCLADYSGQLGESCQLDLNCDQTKFLLCNTDYNICTCDDGQIFDTVSSTCIDI